jgi:hypothetical protein
MTSAIAKSFPDAFSILIVARTLAPAGKMPKSTGLDAVGDSDLTTYEPDTSISLRDCVSEVAIS